MNMNRSYSKIRHIQKSNILLEKRLIKEQQSSTLDLSVELPKHGFKKVSDGSTYQKVINNEKGQKIYNEVITQIPETNSVTYSLYTFGKSKINFPADLNITYSKTQNGWDTYLSIEIPVSRIPDVIKISDPK